jgi:hypothetical protein
MTVVPFPRTEKVREMAPAEPPVSSDAERIARLEERLGSAMDLLAAIRADQREHVARLDALTRLVAGASGGLRVLLVLGAISAAWGVLRAFGIALSDLVGRGGR